MFSFVESKLFTRLVGDYLTDDEYAQLQAALAGDPEHGSVVPGSGGVRKLRWARSKDRDDVRNVIGVQGDRLDWPYIKTWCERHGTSVLLEDIRRTVPKI